MAAKLWVCGGNTRRDNLLARLVGAGGGAEPHQRLICDAPPGAGGRRRGRQVGPKAGSEERSGADGSPGNTLSESVLERWRAQSPRRSRIRKALRKTGFSQGWGVERQAAQRTGSNWGRVAGPFPSSDKAEKR